MFSPRLFLTVFTIILIDFPFLSTVIGERFPRTGTGQMIADAAATALPVVGGVASGVLMYTLFKPRCMKLKRKLKALGLCDPVSCTSADS